MFIEYSMANMYVCIQISPVLVIDKIDLALKFNDFLNKSTVIGIKQLKAKQTNERLRVIAVVMWCVVCMYVCVFAWLSAALQKG